MAALHVGFFAAISSGLDIHVVKHVLDGMTVVTVAPDIPQTLPPPQLPQPSTGTHDAFLPQPIPEAPYQDERVPDPLPLQQDEGAAGGAGEGVIADTFIPATIDPRHPFTQPEYPPRARLLGEEGRVRLRLHVAASGRIDSVSVVSSSGYQRLDDAAIQHALKHWSMVPAARGGGAVESWIEVPVAFHLTR